MCMENLGGVVRFRNRWCIRSLTIPQLQPLSMGGYIQVWGNGQYQIAVKDRAACPPDRLLLCATGVEDLKPKFLTLYCLKLFI